MAAALQIWSATYSKAFDSLPASIREVVQRRVDEMGTRLESFPHKRLIGRPEFKLRVGDYRVLYEFEIPPGRIQLHYVGHRREIYKRVLRKFLQRALKKSDESEMKGVGIVADELGFQR